MQRTKIIAEAASNHGGDIFVAKKMVKAAARAGADYIKFQSWQVKNLKEDDKNYGYFKKRELSDEAHGVLIEECKRRNIKFLTTCFDIGRIEFLKSLGLDTIKVGSPDVGSYRMIRLLRDNFKHLIISTGMAYEKEIRKTAKLLKNHRFTFLHCVSLYPTPPEKVNIARMDWLKQFTPSVGFSDHTVGIETVKLAIARGANFIEKHFTLKKIPNLPFSVIAAEPNELKQIVEYAEEASTAIGHGHPTPSDEELKSRKIWIGRWGNNR